MNLSLHTNTVQLCSNITIQYPWVYLANGLMQENLYALVWDVVVPIWHEDISIGGVHMIYSFGYYDYQGYSPTNYGDIYGMFNALVVDICHAGGGFMPWM